MPAITGALLALDVGGTKLAAGVVSSGQLVAREIAETPKGAGAEAVFETAASLLERVRTRAALDVVALGVGCGGPMDATTVSPLNIPAWRRFPLAASLEERLGLPVSVDNDAKALALAEGWLGAARGATSFLAMVVSTGVGGGLVLDGRLLDGLHRNAGHVGHVIVEPDGRPCACGGHGCLEAEVSGTAIAATTGRPAKDADAPTIERCGTLVGRAVASVANLLDLELAVVGGSVALGFGAPFFAAAQRELSARARLSFSAHATIVPVGLGDEAPLVGAAAVALHASGAELLAR